VSEVWREAERMDLAAAAFNDRELAGLAMKRPSSLAQLREIEGIGEAKSRTISAADFRDRVAHHSYACGPARARTPWSRGRNKLDVRKFFETADHEVLKASLRRLVKDENPLLHLHLGS
jgi:hypothetical protein